MYVCNEFWDSSSGNNQRRFSGRNGAALFFLKNSGGSYLTFKILCVYVLSGTWDIKTRIWSSRKKMGQQKVLGDTKGTYKVLGDTKGVKWFSKWQICASIESITHYLIHIL